MSNTVFCGILISVSELDKGAIIMLVGPIKYWWGEDVDPADRQHYTDWRDALNDGLVADGYLVYRPHEAFKGTWTERAQSINDLVLQISDVILDMTPPGIPSLGTDAEKHYAKSHGNALILPAPPTRNFEEGVRAIIQKLDELEVGRAVASQEIVLESFGVTVARKWMIRGVVENYLGQVIRLHHEGSETGVEVTDSSRVVVPDIEDIVSVTTMNNEERDIALRDVRKLEVLATQV